MNLHAKDVDLIEVFKSLKKSEVFLYLINKKVIHIKKKRKIFTLLSFFCLHQTSKNKKITINFIHNTELYESYLYQH